ncbi:hypothetical protein AB0N88_05305 [Streptomyces sp. NPDC093516]|uniref:hypothetical protein n=1 Tax=Streptomyces sp. NPDC093516 TaxID=3155304 RepID=UPI00342BFE45
MTFATWPARRGRHLTMASAVLAAAALLTACGATTGSTAAGTSPGGPSTAGRTAPAPSGTASAQPSGGASVLGGHPSEDAPTLAHLAGLGPQTAARVPADARQVIVVTGEGRNSPRSRVVLYQRTASGWHGGAGWAAHNAVKGWTADHHLDDLRSPIGVFTLSDAGGLLSDPGSKLPYTHSGGFAATGTGFEGESLAGSFDYVIAIDYNRVPGTTPLDWTRPLGQAKGGGVWLHVDHGGPTHACVSLAKAHMRQLLRTLDPTQHPVVVMGDGASLRR